MDYRNLLGHHLLHKLPETENYKGVKKLVAARLSACGRDKHLEYDEMMNDIEGIEADRTANGLSNIRPGKNTNNQNKNNQIRTQDTGERRCFICNKIGHLRDQCTSPCKWCKLPGHWTSECDQCPEEFRYRGRSQSRGRQRQRSTSTNRPVKKKSDSPHPNAQQRGEKSKNR